MARIFRQAAPRGGLPSGSQQTSIIPRRAHNHRGLTHQDFPPASSLPWLPDGIVFQGADSYFDPVGVEAQHQCDARRPQITGRARRPTPETPDDDSAKNGRARPSTDTRERYAETPRPPSRPRPQVPLSFRERRRTCPEGPTPWLQRRLNRRTGPRQPRLPDRRVWDQQYLFPAETARRSGTVQDFRRIGKPFMMPQHEERTLLTVSYTTPVPNNSLIVYGTVMETSA